jgi:methylmalonyl-CoA/ethylmalonyl-CoA epimerase
LPGRETGLIVELHLDHIGFVVPVLEVGISELQAVLPIVWVSQRIDDASLGVSVQFLQESTGTVFEVIAPYGPNSPVAAMAAKEKNRLNQLCYRCDDIDAAARQLRKAGSVPLGVPKPAMAFGGAVVQFFWTKPGFILELIEGTADSRLYTPV